MKKSKIQNISIRRIKISQEEQQEILEKLTNYHTKAIKQNLDKTHLSAKEKLKFL